MKQTNSAIKFLVAQYRAIFKSAFSKGLSTAFVLTAALAASSANAAAGDVNLDSADEWKAGFTGDNAIVEITGKDTDKGANGKFKNLSFTATAGATTNLLLKEGQKFVISDSSSATADNKITAEANQTKLTLKGDGDIEIAASNKTAVSGHGLTVNAASGAVVDIDVRNLNVQADLVLKTTGTNSGSDVTVAADSITIGDGEFIKGSNNELFDRANVTVGDSAASGSVTLGNANSVITVKKDGTIAFNGTQDNNGGSSIVGNTLTLDGGALVVTADTDKNAYYHVTTTNVNDGYVNVKSGAALNLDIGTNGAVNFNGQSTLSIADDFKITEGTVKLGANSTLAASAAGAKVTVSGSTSNSGVLSLNSDTLKSFLTGKTIGADGKPTTTAMQFQADAYTAAANAESGAVLLNKDGVLEFVDAADLADFTFSGSGTDAGKIIVSAGGVIAGKDLAVSGKLADANTLTVEATNLTLGSEKFSSSTDKLNVAEFNAENVKFINKSGETVFTLQDKIVLETENQGSIRGNINVSGGQIAVKEGSYTLANNLKITSGDSSNKIGLHVNGAKLTLTGELETVSSTDGKILIDGGATLDASHASKYALKSGTIAMTGLSNLVLDGSKVLDSSKFNDTSVDFASGFDAKTVSGVAASTLTLTGVGSLKIKQFQDLQTKTGFNGFITGFGISDVDTSKTSLTMGTDTVLSGTSDEIYHNAQVKVSGAIEQKAYSFGSVVLANEDALSVGHADGAVLKLTNAAANNNDKKNFVQTASGKAGDVQLTNKKTVLQLVGEGNLGSIKAQASGNGTVVIGDELNHKTANVSLTGNIGETNAVESVKLMDNSTLNIAKGKSINTQTLFLNAGSHLNAESGSITLASAASATSTAVAKIYGDIDAKDFTFSGSGSAHIAGNATVDVGTLTSNEHAKIYIGDDEAFGGTVIADSMTLAKGTIVVDPKFGNEASYLVVNKLTGGTNSDLDGKIVVSQNAVAAIGFDNKAEVEEIVHNYLDANGSFFAHGPVQSALVLDKAISITSGNGVVIDSTAAGATSNAIRFGANSALILTDTALVPGKAAITLNGTTAGDNKIFADKGGVVLLAGDFHETDAALTVFSGTNAAAATLSSEIELTSLNGLLRGTIGTDGKAADGIKLDKDKLNSQMAGISAPVRDLFIKVMGKDGDKYFSGAGVGAEFIKYLKTTSMTGVEADAAAHAATYAGAQQAAVAAVSTMAEAVAGRAGVTGAENTVLAATGSKATGGVWVTPMYKSVDSDGFDAQGGSYGADVDLAGVTFGADSVRGDMRFGFAFNIGSGDADGKGNGNGLKDEFDYYGFGMYTAMSFGDISVLGDASVNVISHDVKGGSGVPAIGELSASADTTAVTMGVTGQYTIATPMVDVVPHAGLRFTRLDTDSYELKSGKGSVANTDYDVQNVFSIPLGVTLSKVFENNGWVYAPQADISLTFNTGDTEVDSNTKFTDVTENLALNTEVMDKVTYGLNVGFAAQNGNFGTSINVGYTGSSNTDSVGVNANARYMF